MTDTDTDTETGERDKRNLTRSELARFLYVNTGSVKDAYRFIDAFFNELSRRLVDNEEVRIQGFGKFRCIEKKGRIGRNPKTGEAAEIAPRRVVSFIAGGKFKRMMQEDDDEQADAQSDAVGAQTDDVDLQGDDVDMRDDMQDDDVDAQAGDDDGKE